ncbi:hypothetical protein IWZ00DRAFT_166874 [Phyllosticta capitalensis]
MLLLPRSLFTYLTLTAALSNDLHLHHHHHHSSHTCFSTASLGPAEPSSRNSSILSPDRGLKRQHLRARTRKQQAQRSVISPTSHCSAARRPARTPQIADQEPRDFPGNPYSQSVDLLPQTHTNPNAETPSHNPSRPSPAPTTRCPAFEQPTRYQPACRHF